MRERTTLDGNLKKMQNQFKKRQKRKRIVVREEERNYACYLFVQGKQLVVGDVKVARLIE